MRTVVYYKKHDIIHIINPCRGKEVYYEKIVFAISFVSR